MLHYLNKKINKVPSIATLTTIFAMILVFAGSRTVSAATHGIDMLDACNYQYGLSTFVRSTTGDVMGWRCYINGSNGVIEQGGVNLNRYCSYMYGSSYKAHYSDFNNPYSWYCGPK